MERLRSWKDEHERWVATNLNKRQSAQQAVSFNVTSVCQQGGITAGIVNVGPQPRKIDDGFKAQFAQLIPDKTRVVTITSVLGDSEAYSFAMQIKDYLTSQGYQIDGVIRTLFKEIAPPQSFIPETCSIIIGSRQ